MSIHEQVKVGPGIYALVDVIDFSRISSLSWSLTGNGYPETRWRVGGGVRHRVMMHRLITGAQKGEVVDHINGNILDNRRCNLRRTDAATNSFNHHVLHPRNTSGARGVQWRADCNGWLARITYKGRTISLGVHADIDDAVAARKAAELRIHGELASVWRRARLDAQDARDGIA